MTAGRASWVDPAQAAAAIAAWRALVDQQIAELTARREALAVERDGPEIDRLELEALVASPLSQHLRRYESAHGLAVHRALNDLARPRAERRKRRAERRESGRGGRKRSRPKSRRRREALPPSMAWLDPKLKPEDLGLWNGPVPTDRPHPEPPSGTSHPQPFARPQPLAEHLAGLLQNEPNRAAAEPLTGFVPTSSREGERPTDQAAAGQTSNRGPEDGLGRPREDVDRRR